MCKDLRRERERESTELKMENSIEKSISLQYTGGGLNAIGGIKPQAGFPYSEMSRIQREMKYMTSVRKLIRCAIKRWKNSVIKKPGLRS